MKSMWEAESDRDYYDQFVDDRPLQWTGHIRVPKKGVEIEIEPPTQEEQNDEG